jgi:hypothetical protein
MTLTQLRNVNFGRTKANATGSSGVGYSLLDSDGNIINPRTTSGVYQLISGSGIYAASITFPDAFHGQLLWDTGSTFTTTFYAVEQYNVEENNPNVDKIYDISFGRWKIVGNQMQFFKEDNVTLVATFDLFDDLGNPTMDQVFERRKV